MPSYPQSSPSRNDLDPNLDLLKQLLSQDAETRDLPAVPRLGQQGGPIGLMSNNPPQDSLQSIATPDLMGHMNTAREGGNLAIMRALRGVIEGRTTDQIARGQGPQGAKSPAQGVSSAEKQTQSYNSFKILSDALFGANNVNSQPQ